MREKIICVMAFLIMLVVQVGSTRAEDKTFYWIGVIDSNESYDSVYVYDANSPPWYFQTIVDMIGGHVGNYEDADTGMHTYDSSVLNVYDGVIDYLHVYNSSTVNISGGLVSPWECWGTRTISAHDSSTINIYDGAFLFGGSFHNFEPYDSSTVNIHGGDVALFLLPQNSSVVNVYNGRCSYGIHPYHYSTVNVYGGYIGAFLWNAQVPETATLNVFGYGFEYDPQALWVYDDDPNDGWWVSKLTGHGCDGEPITYWGLPDPSMHSNINLIPDFVLPRGVNFADFVVFASAWRSSPGDDNWNQICDISDPNDGLIDERDLDVLAEHWLAGVE